MVKNRKGGAPTITELARKKQILEVTRELIAQRGHGGVSLAGIAAAAGVTKAAVLYYFPSKLAIVEAAYAEVITALVADVGQAVAAAAPAEKPAVYVRGMIGHFLEHPGSVRVITEAFESGSAAPEREGRWRPLAEMIEGAASVNGVTVNARTLAILVGGGIDGIVAERLDDPEYDTAAAAEQLIELMEFALQP